MTSDHCLETYLGEIDRVPLLTAEEEVELGRRIQKGDMEAKEHMIRANLRLVVSVAKRFQNRGLALPDLIAEGNIGLMKAAVKFDPEAGFRFSTYATWWIQQTIRRGVINTAKTVRIPSYMVEILTKWGRAATALGQSLGRPATADEIANHLQLSNKNRRVIEQTLTTNSGKVELGDELLRNLAEDKYQVSGDRLTPDEIVLRSDALETVSEILELIDPTEAQVLKMRYGINQRSPSTLEVVAKELSISRERVRQIERNTLRKLHAYVVDGVSPEQILPADAVRKIREGKKAGPASSKTKGNGDNQKRAQ
jgi:RNA polymerase primary sigma factor